jgi:hypothetical protein
MHYLLYITGVLLLTLPTGFFARNRLKVTTLSDLADRSRHRYGWLHILNAIDLLRAFGGLTLITTGFALYEPTAPLQLLTRIMVCIAAVLGLLLQHAFHETDTDELQVPVAFAIGLVAALLPFKVSLLVLPLAIASAVAMRSLGLGLALGSVTTAVLGKLLGVSIAAVGTASLVFFLPIILSGLLHRRLVITIRRGPEIRYGKLRDTPIPAAR